MQVASVCIFWPSVACLGCLGARTGWLLHIGPPVVNRTRVDRLSSDCSAIELRENELVRPAGIEPAAFSMSPRCSSAELRTRFALADLYGDRPRLLGPAIYDLGVASCTGPNLGDPTHGAQERQAVLVAGCGARRRNGAIVVHAGILARGGRAVNPLFGAPGSDRTSACRRVKPMP
jgi:hypothetical protein